MMAAAGEIAEKGGLGAGRLLVTAVIDEEYSSIGARSLVKEWTADAAVVGEPTDMTVAVGHKGFEWVEIDVEGRAAHGSRPADGLDAIVRMGRVLGRLERLDRRPSGPPGSSVDGDRVAARLDNPGRPRMEYVPRQLPTEDGAPDDRW